MSSSVTSTPSGVSTPGGVSAPSWGELPSERVAVPRVGRGQFAVPVPAGVAVLVGQVRRLREERLDGAGLAAGSGPLERAGWVLGLRQLVDAVEAVFVEALADFDAHGDGERLHGARSSAAWLRAAAGMSGGDASGRVAIARRSRTTLAASLASLADGAVSVEHVRGIEWSLRAVPAGHDQDAATILTELAVHTDPGSVRLAGRRLREAIDPDRSAAEANRQFERRYLQLSPLLDGMVAVDGLLDAEAAAMVTTALAPFLVPAGPHDARTTAQRRADGLVELARGCADHTLLPAIAGQRPHLELTMPLTDLQQLPNRTWQRRTACDADIARIILDPDSIPIDVGRRHRLFTPAQRRALAIRDQGCRFPGCHHRPAVTDAHHIVSWLDGGPTDLHNAVLLCRYHHRHVHEGGWTIRPTSPDHRPPGHHLTFHGPHGQRLTSSRGP
jgi:hypothetical protein